MSAPSDPSGDPELEELARLLDEVAAQEASDTRAAAALGAVPGLARVESTLQSAWGPAPRASNPRLWSLVLLGVAASLVLLLWLRETRSAGHGGPRGEYLGETEFEVLVPGARTEQWDRIEWAGPADGDYRVTVRDASTGALLLGPLAHTKSTVLPLGRESTSAWPPRILIELELRRADGSWASAAPREAELAP